MCTLLSCKKKKSFFNAFSGGQAHAKATGGAQAHRANLANQTPEENHSRNKNKNVFV